MILAATSSKVTILMPDVRMPVAASQEDPLEPASKIVEFLGGIKYRFHIHPKRHLQIANATAHSAWLLLPILHRGLGTQTLKAGLMPRQDLDGI